MKIRHSIATDDVKVETQMTPMIDVVFLLLIFFLVTFKIVSQEGDFDITMPPPESAGPPDAATIPIVVRMTSDAAGNLVDLIYKDQVINAPSDDARFDALQELVYNDVENLGPELTEVEIDFDSNLQYGYVMTAISHINGRYVNNQLVDMVEKIRFTRHPGDIN